MGELLGVIGEKNVFFELHNKPSMLVISSKTKNPAKFLLLGLPLSAEKEGFEPSVRLPVRMFSKHVLSATQASLRFFCIANLINF